MIMTSPGLLGIAQQLTGRNDSAGALAARLDQTRVATVAQRLSAFMDRLPDGEAAPIRARMDLLSEHALGHVLRNPALFEALALDDVAHTMQAFAEVADKTAPGAERSTACPLDRLDRSEAVLVGRPLGGMVDPRHPRPDEHTQALARITEAFALLVETDPSTEVFITALLSDLVLRCDDGRAGECWGASHGLALGRVLLVNAHLASRAELAEYLLHEMVHVVLDCVELAQPFYRTDPGLDPSCLMASPWSGNQLSGHAFFHALIVWTALHQYWSYLCSDPRHHEEAKRRRAYVSAGFKRLDLIAARAQLGGMLAPHSWDLAARVTQSIEW